ncbi:MAG: rhomboid family intramembrane serine protease [Opitutales bacterium]
MANHYRRDGIVRQQGPLLGLIALMFFIFGCQAVLGPEWYQNLMTVPAEITQSWQSLLEGKINRESAGEFITLLTSAFLHGDPEHVLFNMLFLWVFAALTVDLLGHRWMFLIFTVTAISGSIGHTILNANDMIPMLGASGAVMGFEGAYLGLAIRWKLPDPHVWPMARPIPPAHLAALAVIGVVMDSMAIMNHDQANIAFGAHVGGFLAGLFLTSFIAPAPKAVR